jgi:branched-chain amino acid transport system permease protein
MTNSLVILLCTLALAIALPLGIPSIYIQGLVVVACVYSLLGLSANLVFGNLGYLTFGQAAFVGIGAYTATLLATLAGVNFWLAAAIAMIPGVALGALIGVASLRVGGAYFAIASLTVAEILRLLADNWIDVTRGPMGILLPRPGIPALSQLGLSFNQYYLGICLLVTGLVFLLIRRILNSPVGRAWEAIRESNDLAQAIGVASLRYRVINIALSGAVGSLAGALLIPKILVVTPDLFEPLYSAIALLIVILGGRGTLIGPIIGGIIFAFLPEVFRFVDDARLVIFALLLLITIRIMPRGIAGFFQRNAASTQKEPQAASEATVPERAQDSRAATLLQVNGLTKRFGGLHAVDNLTFSIMRGEIVGLMGPNGAGKTTCLSMISGFLKPSSGDIVFDGRPLSGLAPSAIAGAGLVRTFQQTTVFPKLTVLENTIVAAHLAGSNGFFAGLLQGHRYLTVERRRRQIAFDALGLVGLKFRANERASALPYGQQKLLTVAIALAARPKLLLLDEPAAGLNPSEADALSRVIEQIRRAGVTVIIVEHNVPMMMAMCDRLVVLHHGVLIASGPPDAVRKNELVQDAYFGDLEAAHAAG